MIRDLTVRADQLITMVDMRLTQDAVDDEELLKSIQTHGIKDALTCRYTEDPEIFEIVDGRRRFHFGKIAGLTEFRITAEEMTDLNAYAIAFVKNNQRKSMDAVEEGIWLQGMVTKFELTQKALADSVGKSIGWVNGRLKLARRYEKASPEERKILKNPTQVQALERLSKEDQVELIGAAIKSGALPPARELLRKAGALKEPREVLEKWRHNDDEFVLHMLTEECGLTVSKAADLLRKFRTRKLPWQQHKTLDQVTHVPDGDPKAKMYAELGKWYPLEVIDAVGLVAPAKTLATFQNNTRMFIRELYRRTPANTKTMLQELFL